MLSMNGKRMKRLTAMLLTICMLSGLFADLPIMAFRGRAEASDAPLAEPEANAPDDPTLVGNEAVPGGDPAPGEEPADAGEPADGETPPEAGEADAETDTPEGEDIPEADETDAETDAPEGENTPEPGETDAETDAPEGEKIPEAGEADAGTDVPEGEDIAELSETDADTDAPEGEDITEPSETDAEADAPEGEDAPEAGEQKDGEARSADQDGVEEGDATDEEQTIVDNEDDEDDAQEQGVILDAAIDADASRQTPEADADSPSEPAEGDAPEETAQGEPENAAQDVPESAVKDAPEATAQDVLETAPQDVPETAPQDEPKAAVQDEPKAEPETAPQDVPAATVQETSEEDEPAITAQAVPEDAEQEAPEAAVQDKPEDVSETPVQDTPVASTQSAPEAVAQDTPETTAQDAPETPTQSAPETTAQDVPETTPQAVPETTPQDVPETPTQDAPETPAQDVPETPAQDAPETPAQDEPEAQKQTDVEIWTQVFETDVALDIAQRPAQVALDAPAPNLAQTPAQVALEAPAPSMAEAPTQDQAADDGVQADEPAAQTVTVSPEAVQLAATMAALASPGTTTDAISSGNSAKDMAASVEFQDPFNPSDNPVPVKTLQQLIEEKLATMNVLTGNVLMKLGRNTSYAGDIALKRVNLGKIEDDFVLELASEDAGEDGLSADGSTVLDGNLAVEGLNVVMKGVRMALNKVITVAAGVEKVAGEKIGGSLKYYGTTADDIVTIEAGSGGSAAVYTGAGNDRVGLLTANGTKQTTVDSGAGDDTVFAYINGGTSTVRTGEGDDRLELYSYAEQAQDKEGQDILPQITVSTGAGNDDVQLALSGSASVDVDTGEAEPAQGVVEDDDTVAIFGRYGGGNVSLRTEDGSDYVRIAKNFQAPDLVRIVPDVTGVDQLEVTATGEGVVPNPVSVMDIDLGAGSNRADIDMSVGDTYARVDLSGDTAHRVHLTGALKPELEQDETPISGDAQELSLLTENGNTLSIKTTKDGVTHHFTDNLQNKLKVTLYEGDANPDEGNKITPKPFTDYVLKFDPKGKTIAPFKKGAGALLTNLVVDADALPGWRNVLDVQTSGLLNVKVELGDIDAGSVNLLVRGAQIIFEGKVKAENVMAYARDNSKTSMDDICEFDFGMDELGSKIGEMLINSLNVYHDAQVHVKKGAQILSRGDVDLTATVEENGSMLSFLPNSTMNVLNVKVGEAAVTVDGVVKAGFEEDGARAWKDGYGSVKLEADVRTMCGYKYEPVQSEAFQATAGYKVPYLSVASYPVALNVVVSDSNVKVNQTAQIIAASDIAMRSENETRAMANAASGLIQIPVSIAVNVVSSDARSLAKGELTAGGNVLIASRGAQYVVAKSAHGSSQTLLNSGLYGALNVVVQNVTSRTGLSDDEKGSDMTRITAGGNVRVKSETLADVRDNVTSGVSPNSPRSSYTLAIDGVGNFLSTFFMKYLIQKGKIKDNNAAIKAAMGFLSASEYHIERINDPGDDAGGTINSAKTVMENGEPVVKGTYSVKPGYVGVVRYRWLVPGEDTYHMGVAGFDEASGTFSFTPPAKNVYIELITTETSGAAGVEAGKDDSGVQNVNDIVEGATGGAKKSADEQSDAGDIKLTFNVGNTGDGYNFGTLLTRQCDENGKSILTTSAGNTVEIVPNPIVNYKVKDDTITVRYYEPEDYYAKYMQVKVNAQGEYVFKVPQGISANRGIEVMASFEQITTASDTNLHDYQVSGTAGMAVVINHGTAEIGRASVVSAENGNVDTRTIQQTRVLTEADGTAISEEDIVLAKDAAKRAHDAKPQKVHEEFTVPQARYAVHLTASSGGTVEPVESGGVEDGIHYSFVARPSEGNAIGDVYVTYFQGEEVKYKKLEPEGDRDGGKLYKLDLTELGEFGMSTVDKGMTVGIGFEFVDADGKTVSGGDFTDDYIVRNPISIRTNVLNDEDSKDPTHYGFKRIGDVTFVEEKDGEYWFRVVPHEDDGYTIDPTNPDVQHPERSNAQVLYVSYVDGAGVTRRAPMMRDPAGTRSGEYWYFKPSTLAAPAGAVISVNATFSLHVYEVKAVKNEEDSLNHGQVVLSASSLKKGDTLTITAAPETDYAPDGKAIVRYYYAGVKPMEVEVPLVNGQGQFTFNKDMQPDDLRGFEVVAAFREKNVQLYNLSASGTANISASRVSLGESVAVELAQDKLDAGYKLTQVTLTASDGTRTVKAPVSNGRFVVPADWTGVDSVKVVVDASDMALKEVPIEGKSVSGSVGAENVGGRLTPTVGRADRGETVNVQITPSSGCRVQEGTAYAIVKNNSEEFSVPLERISDSTWKFQVPLDLDVEGATIALTAKFEEGRDSFSSGSFSVGAALGVHWVDAENVARVLDKAVVTASNVQVLSRSSGTDRLTVKAGYNQSDIGIAGAIAAQVIGFDTQARVMKGATMNLLSGGALDVSARSGLTFDLTADASGQRQQGSTVGVGAGIAVGVRGADTRAAVEDGARLAAVGGGALGNIGIDARQAVAETVAARAGSAGGVSVTPVAALDIFGSSAEARLGDVLAAGNDKDKLSIKALAVRAVNDARHTVTANATAAGKSAGIGGAYGISIVGDSAKATLGASVSSASDVTVNGKAKSTLYGTVVSGAAGGARGKSNATGASGTSDRQANQMISSASSISAGHKSANVSTAQAADRQKAQTTEGSVAGAAAMALNVMFNRSKARVEDGVNIIAGGAVKVVSENRGQATLKANASATRSDVGIGVGAAVNALTIENTATVGTGAITAASLDVVAKMTDSTGSQVAAEQRYANPQTTDAFAREIYDLFTGLTADEEGSEFLPTELLATFASVFAASFLEQTGLDELLGEGTLEAKLERAEDMFYQSLEHMKNLPGALLEPLRLLYDDLQDTLDMTREDWEDVLSSVENEVIHWLPSEVGHLVEEAGMAVVVSLAGEGLTYLSERLRTKTMGKKQDFINGGIEVIKESLVTVVNIFVTDLVEETMTVLSAQVPLLTRDRLNILLNQLPETPAGAAEGALLAAKWANSEEKWDTLGSAAASKGKQLVNGVVEYVLDTIKTNVFDYEAVLGKIYDTDVEKMMENALVLIKDSLKEALKESEVAVVNKAISAVTQGLNLQLEPEGLTNKHVANTQAVSGAGAETVGVAGSLALTVFLADTVAEIAGSDNALNITGRVNVQAKEIRRLTNNASGATDPDGNADTNDRAAGQKSADVGSGAGTTIEDKEKNLTVKAGVGGSIAFDGASPDRVIVTVQDGYRLKDEQQVLYEGEDGASEDNWILLTERADGTWYFDCTEAADYGKYMLVNVEFEEVLSGLPDPRATVKGGQAKLPADPVSLSVDGREKEDGKWVARKGDLVLVTTKNVEGLAVGDVSYTVKKPDGTTEKVPVAQILYSNAQQTVYQFSVRYDGDITSIDVEYLESAAGEGKPATSSKDESGKSVGVGASFAMILGLSDVKAVVGENRRVTAGAAEVSATSDHQEKINAVAGTDPLQSGRKGPTSVKDISIDAAVALNVLDNDILASVGKGGELTTLGYANKTGEANSGDLKLEASETDLTWIRSSGYSTGDNAAVGASAALNLGFTDVKAVMGANATLSGDADISARSHSEDKTSALATAVGADIQRYLDKFSHAEELTEQVAQSVADGSIIDKMDKALFKDRNKNNSTASKVNKRLDETGSGKADNTQSTTTNAMSSQNVRTADTSGAKSATDTAGKEVKDGTGQDVAAGRDAGESSKLQVAAALGMTLTRHVVESAIDGSVSARGAASVTAGNTANYNTLGTGVAMSLANKSNAIAAAAAVSASRNKALVNVNGDVLAGTGDAGGDLTLAADLTQNMDGQYRGLLAAQSLAGSVAGADSKVSIAGAISLVLSEAAADVRVAGGADSALRLSGDKVSITANDKSRLAARAGGLSVSKGASVGSGLAATILASSDTVNASVGDNTAITAGELDVSAVKQAVTIDDYQFPLSLTNVVSDSSKLTADQRQNVETGIIDVHRGGGEDNYTIDINVRSTDVLKLFDALNFLSSVNYYAEAVAGSISAGKDGGKLSVAGSAAVTVFENTVNASLGNNVAVNLKKAGERTGAMRVAARTETNARLITGSISAGNAKVSGGLGFGLVNDNDTATAKLGDGVNVEAEGDVDVNADADGSIQVFNAAASVAAGSDAKAAVGGSWNAIHDKHVAQAAVGEGTNVNAGGKLNVKALTDMDLIAVTASVTGSGGKAAVGGTIQVVVNEGESRVKLGDNHNLKATGDVGIAATMREQLIAASASASVATQSSGASIAGNLAVLVSLTKARVNVGGGKGRIESTQGSVVMDADSDTRIINAMVSAAGGAGVAVGASVGVGVFGRQASVTFGGADKPADYAIVAKEDVVARARATDTIANAGLALSAGTGTVSFSGTFITDVGRSRVKTSVEKDISAVAGNNAAFDAYHSGLQVLVGGAVGVTTGSAGVGASMVNMVQANNVETSLGNSVIEARAENRPVTVRQGAAVSGVHVGAKTAETQVIVGFGAAGGSSAGVTGTVATATAANIVRARTDEAVLRVAESGGARKDSGNVIVSAENDVSQGVAAGGVNAAGSAAVGASVVSQVNGNLVEALAGDISARDNVDVRADSKELYVLSAANIGAAGSAAVEVGAAVQVLMNKVKASQSGTVAAGGNYGLTAKQDVNAVDVFVAIAGAGAAAVTPIGAVTFAMGQTEASLERSAVLTLKKAGKTARVSASSDKDIYEYIVGGAGSGTAGVSGSVALAVGLETVNARVKEGSRAVMNGSDFEVATRTNYAMQSVTGAVAIGGVAGVAVNAALSVLMDSATAVLDGSVVDARDVRVKADSERDVIGVVANATASGTAAVGVSVLGFAAGAYMSQDAADMLAYGNAKDKSGAQKTFDADAFLKTAASEGALTDEIQDLGKYTQGDGNYHSKQTIGQSGSDFDATSGLVSDDFNKQGFIDQDAETQRGENHAAAESKDVESARQLDTYTYKFNPLDGLVARIGSTANIEAKNAAVSADQNTRADLYAGSANASGVAGVGVSTAAGVLFSSVQASSTGTIKLDDGDLSVTATSRSGKVKASDDPEEQKRADALQKSLGDALNPVNRSLRAVSLAAAAGVTGAGVGVSAAVILTDNKTEALLGGTASGVRNLNVSGSAAYTDVLAASVAGGAGLVGVSGAVGVALANGRVDAIVDSGAKISRSATSGAGNYSVTTNTGYAVNAFCATVAGGIGGVNAGLSFAGNRMQQNAIIRDGAVIDKAGTGALTVKGTSDTSVNSIIGAVNVSGIAVAPAGAVAIAAPTVNTSIGGETGVATVNAGGTDVTVANDVRVSTLPSILAMTANLGGITGNALLSFAMPKSTATVRNTAMEARSLAIDAALDAEADAMLISATATTAGLGLSVTYADLSGHNRAVLDVSQDMRFTGNVSVSAGTEKNRNRTSATAIGVAASAGVMSVSANAAAAWNRMENAAQITGSKALRFIGSNTSGGQISVEAAQKASAYAEVIGMDVGEIVVAPSVSVAMLEADQFAKAELPGLPEASASGGAGAWNKLSIRSAMQAESEAKLLTGGGALAASRANAAVAYGRAKSVAQATLTGEATLRGGVDVVNSSSDVTKSNIDNQMFNAIGANAMVGAAFSQDKFTSALNLKGGRLNAGGPVNVTTDYTTQTLADVTPSAAGVNPNVVSMDVNIAVAKAAATVNAILTGSGEMRLANDGKLAVRASGSGDTRAQIKTPNLVVSAISANPNVAYARNITKQAATLGGTAEAELLKLTGAGAVSVLSEIDSDRHITKAVLGGSGWGSKGTKVHVVGYEARVNAARALDEVKSLATVQYFGAEPGDGAINGAKLDIQSRGLTRAEADTGTANTTSLAGVGVNDVLASAAGTFGAALIHAAKMRVGALQTAVDYTAKASAKVGASPVQAGLYLNIQYDKAVAEVSAVAEALVEKGIGDDALEAAHISVLATGELNAYAEGQTPTVSMGMGNVMAHEVTSEVKAKQSAKLLSDSGTISALGVYGAPGVLREKGDVSVISRVNASSSRAVVSSPANSASISIISAGVNAARARHAVTSVAEIGSSAQRVAASGAAANSQIKRGSITASGGVKVGSTSGNMAVEAVTQTPTQGGVITGGALMAIATAADSFKARAVGGRIEAGGAMSFEARANSSAHALGSAPGAYTAGNASSSVTDTRVGQSGARQTAIIELDGQLSAAELKIIAENVSSAKSEMSKKTQFALGSVSHSQIPTSTWLETGVRVAEGSSLYAADRLSIESAERLTADSRIKESTLSIGFNVAEMRGDNTANTTNSILFLNGTSVRSGGSLTIRGHSDAVMNAVSVYDGGWSFTVNDSDATVSNVLRRSLQIGFGDDVVVQSEKGDVTIEARAGEHDSIYTAAFIKSGALFNTTPAARASLIIDSLAQIGVGGRGRIQAAKNVTLHADVSLCEVVMETTSDAGGSLSSSARAENRANITNIAKLLLNPNRVGTLEITSDKGDVRLLASSEDVYIGMDAYAYASNAAGKVNAWSELTLNMLKHIYIDNTTVNAKSGEITIRAYNTDKTRTIGGRTIAGNLIVLSGYSKMTGLGAGYVASKAIITGSWTNEIRSKQSNGGYNVALNGRKVTKRAEAPGTNLSLLLSTDYDKTVVASNKSQSSNELSYGNQNDLLTEQDRAALATTGGVQASAVKLLGGLFGASSEDDTVEGLWRSGARKRGVRNPGDIYVLDLKAPLTRDVRMALPEKYRLWRNTQTQMDVYLLPNATRLNVRGNRVWLVQELMGLIVDGKRKVVNILASLFNPGANAKKLGMGSRSVLDFDTGSVRIPEGESFWLYASELSGEWLAGQFGNGFFRLYDADGRDMAGWSAGQPLPEAQTLTGLTPIKHDGDARWYWIGATPEDARDTDAALYLLAVDPSTDEASLWRVGAGAAANGLAGDPADFAEAQRALIFRDRADRDEDAVRYDVLLIDLDAEHEQSTVEFVADLLDDGEPRRPAPLYATLRPFLLDGADTPCYSIRGVLFAWLDASGGRVNLLNGQYVATSDDATFDSPFTRIEDNGTDDLRVVVKGGQDIWPEWMSDTLSGDIQGNCYELRDGEWVRIDADAVGQPA